jgi:hypothetical protein
MYKINNYFIVKLLKTGEKNIKNDAAIEINGKINKKQEKQTKIHCAK